MRFIVAQLDALLTDDLWLTNAAHANHMATKFADRVAEIPHVDLQRAPQANSVFTRLPASAIAPLQDWSFFWTWDPATDTVRWMTSFATTEHDLERFVNGVQHFVHQVPLPAHHAVA